MIQLFNLKKPFFVYYWVFPLLGYKTWLLSIHKWYRIIIIIIMIIIIDSFMHHMMITGNVVYFLKSTMTLARDDELVERVKIDLFPVVFIWLFTPPDVLHYFFFSLNKVKTKICSSQQTEQINCLSSIAKRLISVCDWKWCGLSHIREKQTNTSCWEWFWARFYKRSAPCLTCSLWWKIHGICLDKHQMYATKQ